MGAMPTLVWAGMKGTLKLYGRGYYIPAANPIESEK
jgi:hypothetical protein